MRPPGEPVDDVLQSKVAALRAKYAATLPAQVESLAVAVRAWQAAPLNGALAVDAARIAHRLVGTSGSYGFAEVSDASRAIEGLVSVNTDALAALRVDDAVNRLIVAARAAAGSA